ncbi:MAG: DUF2520 domain-containing protein [Acidobacteriota bacterium]|nr:DUF2520 domain-containing protein [Acidobacteriota bacterium]
MTETIGIMGLGRLGSSLAFSLERLGHRVLCRTRSAEEPLETWAAPCTVLCLCIRDDQIQGAVQTLTGLDLSGKTVLTHSGTAALTHLDPLTQRGAVIGKFHPLQAFTRKEAEPIPPGTPWAFEGEIRTLITPWVNAWKGSLHELSGEDWARYHLAAVTAANFLPLFIRAGARVLEPLAENKADALAWLAPLVRQSLEAGLDADNLLPFSGPAVRGDAKTIAEHEALLAELAPDLLPLYRLATERVAAASAELH